MEKEIICSPLAPAAVGPYSQAVKANGMVYCSGAIGLIPGTKSIIEGGVTAQTRQVMENLRNILQAAGSDFSKVVKCTVLLADMSFFAEVRTFC
jgi:2-iminobutanoate/2-iminopropanoate deaminase